MARETITGGSGVLWSAIKALLNTNFTHLWHLITLSGVAEDADHLGTFTGTTIADSQTMKEALQALETAVELKRNKQPTKLALTSDHTITEAELLANDFISNYGATGEIDIVFPYLEYPISRVILVEATYIIEINPPSTKTLDFAGTTLTADYVVDSPAIIGSKCVITNVQLGASSWQWQIDIARGTFSNPGRVSD